ncbi:hypothetical protein FNV43_RR08360 [Rhamnella rubrinervis]|uniref:Uncharacterized protein n=1 Tax=Rhamnella rubrinervis TaxID=2594499 RepID=A0A8K0HGL5_9ROSA|nr:hypothetical protein FNV43_RR08360 [Rhamnella rubrinervis]
MDGAPSNGKREAPTGSIGTGTPMVPLASPPLRFPVQGQLELGQVLELRVPFSRVASTPPHIRMCNLRMFAMEILDPTKGDGMWLLLGFQFMMILKLMTGSHAGFQTRG